MNEAVAFDGEYVQTVFFAENDQFSIIRVKLLTPLAPFAVGEEIVVTGNFQKLKLYERYTFTGKVMKHPKYGHQFSALSVVKQLPREKEHIIRYIKNLKVKGIGQRTIESLYSFFGPDILQIITENSVRVFDGFSCKQWTKEKAAALSVAVKEQQGTQAYFFTLIKMGFPSHVVVELQEKLQDELPQIIEKNVYQLLDHFDGISLELLDTVVQTYFPEQIEARIHYAIIYYVKRHCYQTGSSVVAKQTILQAFEQNDAFRYDLVAIETGLAELVATQKLYDINTDYALDFFYHTEHLLSQKLLALLAQKAPFADQEALIDRDITKCEADFGIMYAKQQRVAIKQALIAPLFLMTGGPGTGKTTIIRAILEIYVLLSKANGIDEKPVSERIALLAPTGRAAQRMQATTGLPAQTIHRFLGWDMPTNGYRFNEQHPHKSIEFIVIDEASMIDMWVLSSLLQAVPNVQQIIFVGDADQLPSVVSGQCFRDMLKASKIPQVRLSQIFRQKKDSTIIDIAGYINQGYKTDLYFQPSADYTFLPMQPQNLLHALATVAQNALDKGYDMYDIQVLAPLYKGSVGIDAINRHLQRVLNPDHYAATERFIVNEDIQFLPNDKVIQLKNVPDLDVYNGDIGKIISIERTEANEDEVLVDFNGNLLGYTKEEMKLLRHAYCISIHKAQGSEFQVVIMPIFMQYAKMLYRQLLYTGVSRAKKALVILGQEQAFLRAITDNRENERKTLLAYFLEAQSYRKPKSLKEALELQVIGEELGDISPWDFLDKNAN